MLENYLSQSLESHQEISMVAINDDLYALNQDQPFRFPASFTFVLRSLVALESLGKLMDPEFNLMTVAEPLAGELMPSGGWSWTDPMLRRMEQFANTNLQLPAQLEQVLTALDQGELVVRVQDEGLEAGLVELGDRHQGRMFWVLAILLMLAGVQCYVASFPGWGTGFMAVVALIGIVGLGMKRKPTS
jgi:predicted unusual protein kinase regulating ubiquinone biosynthesis (AarF/ABC1/UbiB family)